MIGAPFPIEVTPYNFFPEVVQFRAGSREHPSTLKTPCTFPDWQASEAYARMLSGDAQSRVVLAM
ncbi:MAG TPA: hypothetical protein VEQ63_06475, partial [Bryobacteraceae bacterium]|nr:hypothetical protein [Bryobacteraceae bacterium]